MFLKQVAVGVDIVACAVDVALGQQSQYGAVHAVVGLELLVAGVDGGGDELGHSHLFDMSVLSKGLFNVLQVRATASDDDTAQQLVVILGRYLIAHVLDDFLDTCLDNLDEAAAINLSVGIDRVFQFRINLAVLGIGHRILQLHLLGIALLHLQRGDVHGDIIRTQRYDSQMAQHIS